MASNNGGSMMAGFLLGAIVGAGVGLIFAPMAGEETRRHLGETARKLKDGTQRKMDDLKGAVKDRAGQFTAAIDAGKDAFRRDNEPAGMGKDRV